jgi:hypothetical protein
VQLYTDKVPAYYQPTTSAEENRKLLNDKFGTAQLPTYVILKPLGNGEYQEISRYEEGKINNVEAFLEFLRKPLEGSGARTIAQAGGTP